MNIDDRDFRIYEIQKAKLKICEGKHLDLRKAFDSIHREKVFEILKAYDILLLKAIETTYTNTKAKVITSDGILVILISKQESYKAIRLLIINLQLYLTIL